MATLISQRLSSEKWDMIDALDALSGRALPQFLGHHVTRLCVVNGLRNHVNFGSLPEVDELCRTPGQEMFARALNAGIIMNNEIPDAQLLQDAAWHPYCIHYPRIASESTYRRLATTFPQLRYQVGRACATAGYSQLYSELDLLPDACIAEEARESSKGSTAVAEGAQRIYEYIMAAPTRYNVMNDYTRTIQDDQSHPGACLNADTQVLASLKIRFRIGEQYYARQFFPWRYFNITEDGGIDENGVDHHAPPHALTESEATLLDSPLPRDLPTIYKDLLILAAAFEGNVDRYARLRRPGITVKFELFCVIHGVYKSTALAHWLDRNPDIMHLVYDGWCSSERPEELKRAIHARRVMNNDVHHIIDADPAVPDRELPYWIWWPTIPSPSVLLQLAEKKPAMRLQCVRACIAGGYEVEYAMIMDMDGKSLLANRVLMEDARTCPEHEIFEPDMLRRMKEQGIADAEALPDTSYDRLEAVIPWRVADPSDDRDDFSPLLDSNLSIGCDASLEMHMDDNFYATMGYIRRYLSTPPEVRARKPLGRAYMSRLEEAQNLPQRKHDSLDRTLDEEGSDACSWYGFKDGS